MSKTHWLAIPQVLLTAAEAAGWVAPETSQAVQYLLGVLFAGSLAHRGVKVMQGTGS